MFLGENRWVSLLARIFDCVCVSEVLAEIWRYPLRAFWGQWPRAPCFLPSLVWLRCWLKRFTLSFFSCSVCLSNKLNISRLYFQVFPARKSRTNNFIYALHSVFGPHFVKKITRIISNALPWHLQRWISRHTRNNASTQH